VVTWGDYFQTELAFELMDLSDEEFRKAIETVKFDIISSFIIFSEKGIDFFEWVDSNYETYLSLKNDVQEEDLKEALHLKILKDYFVSLQITNIFTKQEMKWHSGFKEGIAV